eukprot:COSAG01_NODE_768_length_13739_cov_6.271334_12_plen_138_part_00
MVLITRSVHSRAGDLLHLVYAPELSHTLDAGDRRRVGEGGGAGELRYAGGEQRESDAAAIASSSSINRFKYTVLLCDTMKPRERAELFLGEPGARPAQLTRTPRAQLTETPRSAPPRSDRAGQTRRRRRTSSSRWWG